VWHVTDGVRVNAVHGISWCAMAKDTGNVAPRRISVIPFWWGKHISLLRSLPPISRSFNAFTTKLHCVSFLKLLTLCCDIILLSGDNIWARNWFIYLYFQSAAIRILVSFRKVFMQLPNKWTQPSSPHIGRKLK